MTTVDLVILGFAALAAMGGFRLGLLARASSWVGLLAGLAFSTRVVEPAVGVFDRGTEATRLLVAVTVVGGLALLGQGIGFAVGARLRVSLPPGPVRILDSLAGSVAGVAGVLLAVWLLLPTMGLVPGEIARAARNSVIVGLVDDVAPEPPAALRDLSQRVADFDFPEVFTGMAPAPETGPPPDQLPIPGAVVDLVAPSTVNVEAQACGRIQEGSGFVVEPGLVVTNAHVVAGADTIEVLSGDGSVRQGAVVVFDDDRDLALVSVPDLQRPALGVAEADEGQGAAVFGHPAGQDQLRVAPATVSQQLEAVGRDIYNRDRVRRQVLILASRLQQGDSGAAVVDADGSVIGVAFAIAPDRPGTAYALSTTELRAVLRAPRGGAVSTGPCL